MSDKKKPPRRKPGEGTIDKITLKSGRTAYRAWLTVGYKQNVNGTRTPIRRTVQHRKQQVVLERLKLLREKYRVELDLEAEQDLRLSALFEKWLAHYITVNKPKQRTPGTYRWAINRALGRLGDPLAARVTSVQLQELLNGLAGELKPKSLNLIRVVLDGAFGQAVLWRIRPDNPAADLKLPRDDDAPELRRVLNADEGQRYLAALQRERLGLAVALTLVPGIRPGESVALPGRMSTWRRAHSRSRVPTISWTRRSFARHRRAGAGTGCCRCRPSSSPGSTSRSLASITSAGRWASAGRRRMRG